MPLKCVPLYPEMCGESNKLDLKAVFRRRKQNNWGEPELDQEGREQWDLCHGLPLRRYADWQRKGFEYVTLADEQSLIDANGILRAHGHDVADYANQDPRTRSPFSLQKYLEDTRGNRERELAELRDLVAQYGADAVTAIKRRDNPSFSLPAELREVKPAKAAKQPA
jgi:hypothetical protein